MKKSKHELEKELRAKLDSGQALSPYDIKIMMSKAGKKLKKKKKRVAPNVQRKRRQKQVVSSKYVRGLRRRITKHERMLKQALEAEHILFVFQQKFIGKDVFYIVDFYFRLADGGRMVVEIDGKSHDSDQQKHKDKQRDEYFDSRKMHVLRFTNQQVEDDIQAVVDTILSYNPKCWDNP